MFDYLFDQDTLIETQGPHGGHIFPGASREFPSFFTEAPYELDLNNLFTAIVYAWLSTVVTFVFPFIHVWWAYQKLSNGEFDQL